MIFETLCTVFIATFILCTYLDNFHSKRPPGPLRFPLIGTVIQLGVDLSTPIYETFRKFSRQYGPLCSMQLGIYPALIVDDYEITRKLLNHELWVDRFWNEMVGEQRSFGKNLGIIFGNGQTWKEVRRFTIKTLKDFGNGKTKSMESVLDDEVKGLLAKIESLRMNNNAGRVQMKSLFDMPVLNVLWSLVCKTRSPDEDKKLEELITLVDKLSKVSPVGGGILIPFPYLRYIFPWLSRNHLVKEANYQLQEYFREVLEIRRQDEVYKTDQRDYIDVFLKQIDNQKQLGQDVVQTFTDEQFVITTIDLFKAGAETSSNTLEFAIYYLMYHPEVQDRVYEEIARVVGRDRLPTIADKTEMPYTEATLIEIQRMANVLPITLRSPTQDFPLNGYVIPKGTNTHFNLFSLHMDEKFWKDPSEFRPDRFIDSNGKVNLSLATRVIPFGSGRRVCMGETLARATLFTFMTSLVQMYKFEKDEEKVFEPNRRVEYGFTLTPLPYFSKLIQRY